VVPFGTTVSSETLTSGLNQTVLLGGSTVSMTIGAYGEQDVAGGATTGTIISSGGAQYVYSGTASASVISNGGYQDVYDTASSTTVSSGAIEIVESGATASNTTVLSGGEIVVYYGANVSGLTVSTGGTELMLSSGGVFTEGAVLLRGGHATRDLATRVMPEVNVTAPATAEVTVAHLIHAMASFDAGRSSDGSLFESVSGGALHEESGTFATDHHRLARH
jgi:autotransporter passenger strand-loop-strand repeat protein